MSILFLKFTIYFNHKMLKYLIFFISISAFSQSNPRKGKYFIFWGYNRAAFPTSDISFKGPGYDFMLSKVTASDAPTTFDGFETYFNPSLFTIPQFNLHAGVFLKDNLSLSIGWDHMKYVVDDFQNGHITGTISSQVSNPAIKVNPKYVGNFSNAPVVINPNDFVDFEHTDGFNFAALDLDHYTTVWRAEKSNLQLDWINGLGIGLVVPRSDVRLFTVGQNNFWNLAGAGASIKSGLRLNLTKLLFFETALKGGYTDLWDVHTTGRPVDHASQSIWFGEWVWALGFNISKTK